jgi:Cu-processing system permease protein
MRLWTLAGNTFRGLLRNRVLLVFFFVYLAVMLLFLGSMLSIRYATNAHGQNMAAAFLGELQILVVLTGSVGSLFAMVAGAYAVCGEVQSGTILAVMARPLARWEFLAGSYLGAQGMLWIYVAFLLAFEQVISWIAGQRLAFSWVLAAYPLVRYLLYSAIALFFSTFCIPGVALGVTVLVSAVAMTVEGHNALLARLPHWVVAPVRYLFPSTGLLGEEKFLSVTSSPLRHTSLADHLTAVAYGLDYALIMLLLAAWIFRRRPLVRA